MGSCFVIILPAMNEYAIKYSIYPSEEICSYSSVWHTLAKTLDEARSIVFSKLQRRYPHCNISII